MVERMCALCIIAIYISRVAVVLLYVDSCETQNKRINVNDG